MKRTGWLLGLVATAALCASGPEVEQARKLYNLTEFAKSLKTLQAIPQKDAAVYDLMGRNYYMIGDFKKAVDSFSNAVSTDPNNSGYALWLGRAYGRRAETSTPFTAPVHASKARQYFEKAVQLDPKNLEALNDLFEYYLEAPGFLGGGFDKASAMAQRIFAINPAEGYWAKAKLAEKRKEFSSAEQQFRRAIDAAPQQVGRILDLARFLASHGRYQESDQNFQRAASIAPDSPKVLYAQAETYIRVGRNTGEAKALLKRYLSATLTPDDPPRSQAEKLLRQVEGS